MSIENTGLRVPRDGNETLYSVGHNAWKMVEHANYLEIQDPSLGNFAISGRPESQIIRDVIMSPLGQRALGVAQLSKGEQHSTIPNVYNFFRLGHVVGNGEVVRQLAERSPTKVSDTQRLSYVLTVMLDDLAHGMGAHLSDMIIEGGFGGAENAHQHRAQEAWRYGGIDDVLKDHGVKVDNAGSLKGVKIPFWVEDSLPDICSERFQYTIEELRLWMESDDMDEQSRELIDRITDINTLSITEDGKLAFVDEDSALLFSKVYLLLSTEHWNEPVHRVIEHLLIEAIKHAAFNRRFPDMSSYDNGETANIESYLYGVDTDLLKAIQTSSVDRDDFMFAISQMLSQLGKEERWRFVEYKKSQFARFLIDNRAEDYPSPLLNGRTVDFGPLSSAVEIDVQKGAKPTKQNLKIRPNAAQLILSGNDGVQYGLQPMKNRYVDPLVITRNGPKRLSQINPTFKSLLDQHAVIHASKVNVRLAVSTAYEHLIKEVVLNNIAQREVPRRRLTNDQLRWQIDGASKRAQAVAINTGRLVLLNK